MATSWCVEIRREGDADWLQIVGYEVGQDPSIPTFGLITKDEAEREAARLARFGDPGVNVLGKLVKVYARAAIWKGGTKAEHER